MAASSRAASAGLFALPEARGQPIAPVLAGSPRPELRELGPGVALILDAAPLYDVLLVALGSETVVIETPHDPETSRRVLSLARAWRPDAPVGHAVVTHFHADHMGGLAGVLAAGITAVVPGGSLDFYAGVARRRLPPAGVMAAGEPRGRLDGETRRLGVGERTVQLFDVGPTPHADEMLVAWVPELRLLYVSDLLTTFGDAVGPGGEDTRLFAERIRALGPDVALFVPAHGEPIRAARVWDWLDGRS